MGSELFDHSEEEFGTKIHFKQWWKIFNEDQAYYGALVEPSKNYGLRDSINANMKLIKAIYKVQRKLKNPQYAFHRLITLKKQGERLLDIYDGKINAPLG